MCRSYLYLSKSRKLRSWAGCFALALPLALAGCGKTPIQSQNARAEQAQSEQAQSEWAQSERADQVDRAVGLKSKLPIRQGKTSFVEGYATAREDAEQEGRAMMLFFSTKDSRYCEQMAAEAFSDPRIVRLSKRFTCGLIDADQNARICDKFQVTAFPTIQFLSPRGVSLNRLTGKQTADQLERQMRAVLEAVARRHEPAAHVRR